MEKGLAVDQAMVRVEPSVRETVTSREKLPSSPRESRDWQTVPR